MNLNCKNLHIMAAFVDQQLLNWPSLISDNCVYLHSPALTAWICIYKLILCSPTLISSNCLDLYSKAPFILTYIYQLLLFWPFVSNYCFDLLIGSYYLDLHSSVTYVLTYILQLLLSCLAFISSIGLTYIQQLFYLHSSAQLFWCTFISFCCFELHS